MEHEALKAGVVRTLAHRALRQQKSRPVLEALHAYLTAQKPLHLPKGPMGQAITYALNQWDARRVAARADAPLLAPRRAAAARVEAAVRRGLLLSAPALVARPAHRLQPARDRRRARPSSALKHPLHVLCRTGTEAQLERRATALRQQFQRVKTRLRALAAEEGLLEEHY
ncbi:hypothetical protein DAT35_23775 [Vitiosangium sp. GDMCC 1.1324]|nr:hypothetical protein DAT35_23775 [Vitiosangium sp. GDMCC 1.1324]